MNILMMTNTYLPVVGGLERSIQSFSGQFQKQGHKVLIVVPELEGTHHDEKNILRVPALFKFHTQDLTLSLPASGSLSQVVRSFQPDIIHAHYPFLIGETALRLSFKYAKPLVYTQHILFEEYGHYLPVPPSLGSRFLAELSAGFANLATQVIAPSQSIKDVLKKEGVRTPITVVPTGIEVSAFARGSGAGFRKTMGIPKNAFVVGYVGRLAKEKNLDFLTNVLISFLKKYPSAHFMAAGKGPMEESMKRKFWEAGFRKQAHFPGVLEKKKLVDCYHSLDVFAFASKSETQGIVLVEAMASGVPVVALDGPGVREIVRNFENGRLVPEQDEDEFKKSLAGLMSRTKEEREKLKRRARQTAEEFSIGRCAGRALEVYKTAMTQTKSKRAERQNKWQKRARQFSAEWKILANFGRATGKALAGI